MLKHTEEIYKISFSDPVSKRAYLKACKWLAQNVIGKDELSELLYSITKEDVTTQLPTFKITLFASVDEKELREKHCQICMATHSELFKHDNCNCAWCNTKGYQRRTDDAMRQARLHYKQLLPSKRKKNEEEE
ncbi:MAG: hypothetical protein RR744_10680 [Cellulosilyticaceae bacterium]